MVRLSAFRDVSVVVLMACSSAAMRADIKTANLVIEKTTTIPGGELKPGSYTIGVVDSLQDRMVVHIDGDSGRTHLLFLAISKPSVNGMSGTRPVEWSSEVSGKRVLRGFNFDSEFVEFVYPKKDAVAIANANGSGVVAIDPASEGRPELKKLTSQDREMVTLWMLSPVQVGPHQKGISAKHYSSPAIARQQSAPSPEVASSPSSAGSTTASGASSPVVAQLHTPPAPKPYRPSIKRLPQTGSQMPLVWLLGAASFTGAVALRSRRKLLHEAA